MTRSCYKLPYTAKSLKNLFTGSDSLKRVSESKKRVYQRSSTILPEMIGSDLQIHTGNKFTRLTITEHIVGYKLGEFAPSKKRALYKKKKKR